MVLLVVVIGDGGGGVEAAPAQLGEGEDAPVQLMRYTLAGGEVAQIGEAVGEVKKAKKQKVPKAMGKATLSTGTATADNYTKQQKKKEEKKSQKAQPSRQTTRAGA